MEKTFLHLLINIVAIAFFFIAKGTNKGTKTRRELLTVK